MNNVDKQYLDLLQDILNNGVLKHTRAGDTLSVFGRMMRFNLKEGLPLLTTKKVFHRGCIEELLWFLKGDTNIKYLVDHDVHIWTDDAYRYFNELIKKNNEIANIMFPDDSPSRQITWIKPISKEQFITNVKEGKTLKIQVQHFDFRDKTEGSYKNAFLSYTFGDLGDVYGKQWRGYGMSGFDQIQNVISTLKSNPDDRRMLCVAFNPDVLKSVALPPCHVMFQFYTKEIANGKRELSCSFTMRSNDFCCGAPFNILQYAILTHMIAEVCDMEVGELIYIGGDVHVYTNHIENAKEQLQRKGCDTLPTLRFARPIKNIDDFKYEDFIIENYNPDPAIKYELNVG